MNISNNSKWPDIVARRPLTESERAELEGWLTQNPDEREHWKTEMDLTTALRTLRAAPVPTNFTARVMAEIRRTAKMSPDSWRRTALRWLADWRHALPLATALGALALTLGIQAHHRAQVRTEVAQGIELLPLEGLAQMQLWRDFEPIQTLPHGPLPSGQEFAAALE
jgi:anti-sigma factor RsiW